MDLAPTLKVPSMSQHPVTGDWYPTINKPASVVHWLNHCKDAKNVDWVLILDANQIIRHPITPWNLGLEKGKRVVAQYGYLIGCDNEFAKMHTKHPDLCNKVGGFMLMHVKDLRNSRSWKDYMFVGTMLHIFQSSWAVEAITSLFCKSWTWPPIQSKIMLPLEFLKKIGRLQKVRLLDTRLAMRVGYISGGMCLPISRLIFYYDQILQIQDLRKFNCSDVKGLLWFLSKG